MTHRRPIFAPSSSGWYRLIGGSLVNRVASEFLFVLGMDEKHSNDGNNNQNTTHGNTTRPKIPLESIGMLENV